MHRSRSNTNISIRRSVDWRRGGRNSGAIMYSVDVYREEKTRANKMIFEA